MDKAALYRHVGALHASALDQGFLSSLGPKVLAELYRAIDTNPSSRLIVEVQDGEVLGFVTGGRCMGPIYKRMLRRPLHLTRALLPIVLQPRKLWSVLEILRHGHGQTVPADLPDYELLSIALAPHARGTGLAAQLYARLTEACRAEGIESFRITVGDALTPAHRFYTKQGATPVARIEVHKGQGSTIYRQTVQNLPR